MVDAARLVASRGVVREPYIGARVRVHLAEHCTDPEMFAFGVVDYIFPGGHAFTVRFDGLRTEVVARYEIKEVDPPATP